MGSRVEGNVSDAERCDGGTAEAYGVMMPGQKLAMRTTFVIDKSGTIREIQQGNEAIDTSGALAACERVSHGKAGENK
jgi:peroxiredoxin